MKLHLRVGGGRVASIPPVLLAAVLLMSAGFALRLGEGIHLRASDGPGVTLPIPGQWPGSSVRVSTATASLSFEPNQGQSDRRVKFLSRNDGFALFLSADEAVMKLRPNRKQLASSTEHSAGASGAVLHMKLLGANAAASVSGERKLEGRSNYLLGNDPAKWRVNVPHYGRVRYQGIYPGIDLVYYGNQGRVEYDFEVAPNADPHQIRLSFSGAEQLQASRSGSVIAQTSVGNVELHAPVVQQLVDGRKRLVPAKFVISDQRVGFVLGEYDRSKQLVIDPVLTYSTYLGGSGNEGCLAITGAVRSGCPAVAVDGGGNMYVAGTTDSADFPTTIGPSANGTTDVFITKYNSSGNQLIFSTYLGGTGTDYPVGVAVNFLSGNVSVAGNTTSGDFPTHSGFQNTTSTPLNGHAFVSVLNSTGSALIYSTYLSGNGADTATGMAVDRSAGVYVTGFTTSTNSGTGFPSTSTAFQKSSAATSQFFFSKLNTAGAGAGSMVYSSYLGGSVSPSGNPAVETQGGGIAVDASGKVYVTGGTDFTNMPRLNAAQASSGGGVDAFVAKFNPNVSGSGGRLFLTYLGGSGNDVGNGIAVDSAGNAYVTGTTTSTIGIPTGAKPFQPCLNSATAAANACPSGTTASDAFLAKIGTPVSGSTIFPLNYFSYIGGSGDDLGLGIAVDSDQVAHIAGQTSSSDFHVSPSPYTPFQGSLSGPSDAFVARIPTTTTTGAYSTYLGGGVDEDATGVATDGNGTTYVAGETTSTNFPTVAPSQGGTGGAADAFVSKFNQTANLTFNVKPSASTVGRGNQVTFNYAIANSAAGTDPASNVIFTTVLPSGATFNTATATPGACTAAVNSTVTCSVGTLGIGASAKIALNVTPTVAGTVSSSANVTANGTNSFFTSGSAAVTDFSVGVSPATNTVPAGASATYQVTVNPSAAAGFPNSVSIACPGTLPSGVTCTFSTNPVTPNATSVSSTLTIATTARPVTTGANAGRELWYAALIPVSGLAFLGFGMGSARKKKATMGLLFLVALCLSGLQMACGSDNKTPPSSTGTPAGSYPLTLTGTSGSVSHTAKITLVVQ